jgi:uncharacterized coiled-coil protein SlyX
MVDAYSRQVQPEGRAAGVRERWLWWLFAVALGLILVGIGYVMPQRGFASNSAGRSSTSAAEQFTNEFLETTKGLQLTQQQAVDQLQVVQDQLVAQKAETKKLTEQVGILTLKLQTLQQSVAEIPAPSVLANGPPQSLPSKSRQ